MHRKHASFKRWLKHWIKAIPLSCISILYLNVQGTALDFRGAFFDDKGDAIKTVLSYLGKVNPKQVQSTLELLMTTLNGKSLQAFLVTGQGALRNKRLENDKRLYWTMWTKSVWVLMMTTYLLTLSPVEHHQTVTLSAFGRRSQFPQLVGVRRFWHLSIAERTRRTGRFQHHLSET